jgi:uncharacterized membrane protein
MDFVFGIVVATALILALPIMAIAAFIRSGDARRRLDGVEMRLHQAETELGLLRAALAVGEPAPRRVPQDDVALPPAAPEPVPAPPAEPVAVDPTPVPEPAFVRRSVPTVVSKGPLEAIDPMETPASPPPPPVPAPAGLGGFEESIGSRWAVWVGAVALGLGGIFLVRYSIEQGLVGPGMRIALGFLFSLALLAGGEWLRRNDKGLPTLPVADIPSALTGAGAVAAFATIYAAHALYDFIGPATTFLALGAVGLGTLVLAGVHGPLLGAIGLVAAFAAPFLVAADDPNPYVFPIYAAVITAACFTLAWIRDWLWLRLAATGVAVGLGALTLVATSGGAYPSLVQALAGIATAALFLVPGIRFAPPRERGADIAATAILCAFAFLGMLAVLESRQGMAAVALFLLLALVVLALVWRAPSVAPAAPVTGLFALLILLGWSVGVRPSTLVDPLGVPPDFPDVLSRIVRSGLAVALLFGIVPAVLAVARRQREAWVVLTLVA